MVDAKYEQKGMHNIACVLCTNLQDTGLERCHGVVHSTPGCTAAAGADD